MLLRYVRSGIVAGNLLEAKSTVLKLVDLCGTSSLIYQAYGEILMHQESPSEAIDAFQKAAGLDPENHLARGYAAVLGMNQENFSKAITMVKTKIEKHPQWPDLWKDQGELFLRWGDLKEATAALQEALKINPRYMEARLRLAEALQRQGRFDEAVKEILAMKLKDAPSLYLLGICFQAVNRSYEAQEAFERVAKINPSYRDTPERLDELKGHFLKLQSFIEMHQKIKKEQPAYPDIRVKLAQLLAMSGKKREAEIECLDALKINPNYKEAKEELEKIKNATEYQIDWPDSIEHPKHPCHGITCKGFQVALSFGNWTEDALQKERLSNYTIWMKNVRSGKTHEFKLPSHIEPNLTVTASTLCPVAENDTILVKLIDPQSGAAVFTQPFVIQENADPLCKISFDLEKPLKAVAQDLRIVTPVKYFMVHLDTRTLPGIDQSMLSKCNFRLTNPRTADSADGRKIEGNPGEVNFVLTSKNDAAVVQSGDLLLVKLMNEKGGEERSLSFPVTSEDVLNYSKRIDQLGF